MMLFGVAIFFFAATLTAAMAGYLLGCGQDQTAAMKIPLPRSPGGHERRVATKVQQWPFNAGHGHRVRSPR